MCKDLCLSGKPFVWEVSRWVQASPASTMSDSGLTVAKAFLPGVGVVEILVLGGGIGRRTAGLLDFLEEEAAFSTALRASSSASNGLT
jgi:hypothetical protein